MEISNWVHLSLGPVSEDGRMLAVRGNDMYLFLSIFAGRLFNK